MSRKNVKRKIKTNKQKEILISKRAEKFKYAAAFIVLMSVISTNVEAVYKRVSQPKYFKQEIVLDYQNRNFAKGAYEVSGKVSLYITYEDDFFSKFYNPNKQKKEFFNNMASQSLDCTIEKTISFTNMDNFESTVAEKLKYDLETKIEKVTGYDQSKFEISYIHADLEKQFSNK